MPTRSEIMKGVRAYRKVHGHNPITVHLSELKFLHLTVEMLLLFPDGKAREVAQLVVDEGVQAAADQALFMEMHLRIAIPLEIEAEDADVFLGHRATKETGKEAASCKVDIVDDPKVLEAMSAEVKDSIFDQVFGPDGILTKTFGLPRNRRRKR